MINKRISIRNFPSSMIASNDDAVMESFFSITVASRICIAKLSCKKRENTLISMKIKRDMMVEKSRLYSIVSEIHASCKHSHTFSLYRMRKYWARKIISGEIMKLFAPKKKTYIIFMIIFLFTYAKIFLIITRWDQRTTRRSRGGCRHWHGQFHHRRSRRYCDTGESRTRTQCDKK